MTPELKAKWIEALRSGDFVQTKQTLKDDKGYCCLGVLCHVAKPEGYTEGERHISLIDFADDEEGTLDESTSELTFNVRNKLGLDSSLCEELMNMNDGTEGYASRSFSEIADYIEAKIP